MKKILLSLSLLLSFNVLANDNCSSFTYKKSECEFEFTQSVSGSVKTAEFTNENYTGKAIALCSEGKYTIKKAVCESKKADTCERVEERAWSDGNLSCSHKAQNVDLKEGETTKIKSIENNGQMTYECFNGKLQGIASTCEKEKGQGQFTTKSVNTEKESFQMSYYVGLCPDPYFPNTGAQTYCDPDFEKENAMCESKCAAEGYEAENSYVTSSKKSGVKIVNFTCNCSKEKQASQCTNYNTASYSNLTNGYKVTKCYLNQQSNSEIEGLCSGTAKPTVYDGHTILNANGGKTYNVTCVETDDKICPENTSPIEIGDRNDAIKSGLNPYYCDGGVCYFCKEDPPPKIDGLCATCDMKSVTFNTSDNENTTCTVDLGGEEVYSGDTKNKEFFNSIYHGQVSYFCMNGNSEIKSQTCYLNCHSQEIEWSDDGNDSYYLGLDKTNACKDTIDRKSRFKNKERSEVLTSTTNSGNAVFYCNGYNGEWVSEEERCKIDCPQVAYWPDNTQGNINDNAGREKGYNPFNKTNLDMACSYNFGSKQKHGKTATVTSTGSNKGTASLKCNDGYWEVQSQSCNMHCDKPTPSKTYNKCQFNSENVGIKAHNTVVGAFKNDDKNNNGEIKWRCDDGDWKLESATCTPKICDDNAYWSNSTSGCVDTTMYGQVGDIKAAKDTSFPSAGGPTGDANFKCTGYSVNDTKGKWVKSGSSTCWTSYNGQCNSLGYLSSPPSESQACKRNYGGFSTNTTSTKYTWTCKGKTLGTNDTGCSALRNPKCGNDFYDCDIGSVKDTNTKDKFRAYWNCKNGNKKVSCSKEKPFGPKGSCGSAAGEPTSTTPTSGLCSSSYGNSAVSTESNYAWTCYGSDATSTTRAGKNIGCFAPKEEENCTSCPSGYRYDTSSGECLDKRCPAPEFPEISPDSEVTCSGGSDYYIYRKTEPTCSTNQQYDCSYGDTIGCPISQDNIEKMCNLKITSNYNAGETIWDVGDLIFSNNIEDCTVSFLEMGGNLSSRPVRCTESGLVCDGGADGGGNGGGVGIGCTQPKPSRCKSFSGWTGCECKCNKWVAIGEQMEC